MLTSLEVLASLPRAPLVSHSDAGLEVLCLGENEITRVENMDHLALLCSLDLSDNRIEVAAALCHAHTHGPGSLSVHYFPGSGT
jgi:xanthine dehydrogenase iron-sulfur cluster and FAD-binding subunit A